VKSKNWKSKKKLVDFQICPFFSGFLYFTVFLYFFSRMADVSKKPNKRKFKPKVGSNKVKDNVREEVKEEPAAKPTVSRSTKQEKGKPKKGGKGDKGKPRER